VSNIKKSLASRPPDTARTVTDLAQVTGAALSLADSRSQSLLPSATTHGAPGQQATGLVRGARLAVVAADGEFDAEELHLRRGRHEQSDCRSEGKTQQVLTGDVDQRTDCLGARR
jgi:hypothetical protein